MIASISIMDSFIAIKSSRRSHTLNIMYITCTETTIPLEMESMKSGADGEGDLHYYYASVHMHGRQFFMHLVLVYVCKSDFLSATKVYKCCMVSVYKVQA